MLYSISQSFCLAVFGYKPTANIALMRIYRKLKLLTLSEKNGGEYEISMTINHGDNRGLITSHLKVFTNVCNKTPASGI